MFKGLSQNSIMNYNLQLERFFVKGRVVNEVVIQMSNNTDEEEPSWYTLSAYDEDDDENNTSVADPKSPIIKLPHGYSFHPAFWDPTAAPTSAGLCPPTETPVGKTPSYVKKKCDHDWVEIGIVKSIICCKFCGIDKE